MKKKKCQKNIIFLSFSNPLDKTKSMHDLFCIIFDKSAFYGSQYDIREYRAHTRQGKKTFNFIQ